MASPKSFKEYLVELNLPENSIPTVWKNKVVNAIPEDEEESYEDQEDVDVGPDDLGTDDLATDDESELDDIDLEGDPEEPEDPEDPEDPNKMGVIRKVTGAHLIYKRKNEEGTHDELWMYKVDGGVKDELEVRRDILSGTDIPQGKTRSEDKTQEFELWTSGDIQWLHISGLPQ